MAPWADVLYFADSRWWEWHKDRPEYRDFAGVKCTIDPSGMQISDGEVHMLRNADHLGQRDGLALDQQSLITGRNSGYQAINLAVLSGAKRILLLGYDMRFIQGRSHWFGDHPIKNVEHEFKCYAPKFKTMKPQLEKEGVTVINATPGTFIDAFPQIPLDLVPWLERTA